VEKIMKKVLIAEDEAAIREIIAITLQRAGYEVTEACDGEQALLTYTERPNQFDVVLLDIMMPNMDGLEVCKRLRKIRVLLEL
jgi:CheY-like chemotaxis protein